MHGILSASALKTCHATSTASNKTSGYILGQASAGLTDLDLDSKEAILAAPYLLPRTAVFGHASKRASHWIYKTRLFETQDRAAIKFMSADKVGLLEVRMGAGGSAAQTVFPPSTHVSGEPITWEDPPSPPSGTLSLQEAERLEPAKDFSATGTGDYSRAVRARTLNCNYRNLRTSGMLRIRKRRPRQVTRRFCSIRATPSFEGRRWLRDLSSAGKRRRRIWVHVISSPSDTAKATPRVPRSAGKGPGIGTKCGGVRARKCAQGICNAVASSNGWPVIGVRCGETTSSPRK